MTAARKFSCRQRRNSHSRGENNRIQKLLMSEYSEFSDTILVESPFAETTRDGRGIRQVGLALTPSTLIVAADVLKENSEYFCPPDLDPSIECFELVSIYPLEFVTLSVFRRRRRRTLKARFIDGRANYYELGGMQHKSTFWRLWRDHIQTLLDKKLNGSSRSETTVASSSSVSTVYLLTSDAEYDDEVGKRRKKTVCRVWTRYDGAGDYAIPCWSQKDLYLGPSYDELGNGRYTPIPVRFAGASLEDLRYELKDHSPNKHSPKKTSCQSWPVCQARRNEKHFRQNGTLCDVLFLRADDFQSKQCDAFCKDSSHSWKAKNHNRGRLCECKTNVGTYLISDKNSTDHLSKSSASKGHRKEIIKKNGTLVPKLSRFGFGVPEKCGSGLCLPPCRGDSGRPKSSRSDSLNPYELIESGVAVWEAVGKRRSKSLNKEKHFRRYGLSTAAHFLHALGPWSVQPGQRNSVQRRRAFSAVDIRRQPMEPELRLPVSRRQLAGSVSCTALEPGKSSVIGTASKGRVLLFWTPEYWYRPRAAAAAYRELRQHLTRLKEFRQSKERQEQRKFFCRRNKTNQSNDKLADGVLVERKSSSLLGRIFSGNINMKKKGKRCEPGQNKSTASHLKKLLRMDFRISIWDLDSTTLAEQLTLVDRDLFLRIPVTEIEILIFQKSSRNTPNLGAWVAFSHRISCLTVSEILSVKRLDMRSRIVARFINAAQKCFIMGNFHSCRSILAGLQAPPIFRLRTTWSYVRDHHAIRYEIMERLCKTFKSPLTTSYQKAWAKAEHCPCLPYVDDVLVRVLGLDETKQSSPSLAHTLSHRNLLRCLESRVTSKSSQNHLKNSVEDIACLKDCKRDVSKHMLVAAFGKFKYRKASSSLHECKTNVPWSSKEQILARKYFARWRAQVLKRRILASDEKRLRDMDPRRKRLHDVASWFMDCQRYAQGYCYPEHSFALEFLLKARYGEDRDNFFVSLKLEPSKTT